VLIGGGELQLRQCAVGVVDEPIAVTIERLHVFYFAE
jgi:hypothetical protein